MLCGASGAFVPSWLFALLVDNFWESLPPT